MNNVVQITPVSHDGSTGTEVTFNQEEVMVCTLQSAHDTEIQISQKQAPFLFDKSMMFDVSGTNIDIMIITLKIYHAYITTKDSLDTLYAYTNKLFRVYYRFHESASTYILCCLDPNTTESYVWGNQTPITTTMKFYETEIRS